MPIHQDYNDIDDFGREVVNRSFSAIASVFNSAGIVNKFDDNAERLVEAIAKYYKNCKGK